MFVGWPGALTAAWVLAKEPSGRPAWRGKLEPACGAGGPAPSADTDIPRGRDAQPAFPHRESISQTASRPHSLGPGCAWRHRSGGGVSGAAVGTICTADGIPRLAGCSLRGRARVLLPGLVGAGGPEPSAAPQAFPARCWSSSHTPRCPGLLLPRLLSALAGPRPCAGWNV